MMNRLTGLLALLCAALTLIAPSAHAAPSGPSAKAAARLKKNPPTAWLAHYLPDDRYKVAGGVWKYVSTNLDTYYHRPNSSNMLRQPATGVIGFASAQAAEEAGYKPDPGDGTATIVQREYNQKLAAQSQAINGGLGPMAGQSGAAGAPSAPRTGRVTLADGVSTITIPAGWQRLVSQQRKDGQSNVSIDMIAHQGTGNIALLLTMNVPNVDVGRELSSSQNVRKNMQQFGNLANSSGSISNVGGGSIGDMIAQSTVRRTRWGGLTGVAISPPAKAQAQANGVKIGSMIMVGRGSKAYMLQMVGKGRTAPGTSAMINSFKAR